MFPRDLSASRLFHDVAAYVDKHVGYITIRRHNAFRQCTREGGISSLSIQCNVSRLSGKTDHCSDAALDAGQPGSKRGGPGAHRARQISSKWIIPAGIKENKIRFDTPLHRSLNESKAYKFEVYTRSVFQLCINGNEIVMAVYLQGVTSVKENSDLGRFQRPGKLTNGTFHARPVEIDPFDDFETRCLKRGSHIFSIVARISQFARVLIGRVADNQGHSTTGCGERRHRR